MLPTSDEIGVFNANIREEIESESKSITGIQRYMEFLKNAFLNGNYFWAIRFQIWFC